MRAGFLSDDEAGRARACARRSAGDPLLTAEQKQALLNVYESYVARKRES